MRIVAGLLAIIALTALVAGKMLDMRADSAHAEPGRKFVQGLVPVSVGHAYGYADKSGRLVIPATFDHAEEVSRDGLAAVLIGEYPNGKWGFINTEGHFVIPPTIKYETMVQAPGPFSEGLAKFYKGGSIGFIDRSGKVVIPALYQNVCEFSDGRAGVLGPYGRHSFIDTAGRMVIGPLDAGIGCFSEGLVPINARDGYRYVNVNGRVVVIVHASVDLAIEFSEGVAAVAKGKKWCYIDKKGDFVIDCRYDYAGPFKEGLARVEINKKHGYINKSGTIVIPVQYSWAEDFSESLARVEQNGHAFFIDKRGTTVVSDFR